MEDTIIEPTLDSFAGSIELAICMATEIENELTEICSNKHERINQKLNQLHADGQHRSWTSI